MPLTVAGYNALLAGGLSNAITYVSTHGGDPGTTGANETTGGTPAYARQGVTWGTASGGVINSANVITFDQPTGTIYFVGFWNSATAGTFLGYSPIGGYAAKPATVAASASILTSYAHGFSNGNNVLISDVGAAGDPAGLVKGTVYYVVNATNDSFQVALSSGGTPVTIAANGQCVVQRITPEVFAAQGQYQVPAGSLILDSRFT